MDDLTAMSNRLILLNNGSVAYDGTSAGLIERTGDRRTLAVTCEGSAPQIQCAKHLRSQAGQHFYVFDGSHAPQVLESAGRVHGLRDVEITHAPIEEVIADLYRDWQKKE